MHDDVPSAHWPRHRHESSVVRAHGQASRRPGARAGKPAPGGSSAAAAQPCLNSGLNREYPGRRRRGRRFAVTVERQAELAAATTVTVTVTA